MNAFRLNQSVRSIAVADRVGRVVAHGILPWEMWVRLESGRLVLTHVSQWRAV